MKIEKLIEQLQAIQAKDPEANVLIAQDFAPGKDLHIHHNENIPSPYRTVWLVMDEIEGGWQVKQGLEGE